MRPYYINEALESMRVPISSINHIMVCIENEIDFEILERLLKKVKIV